MLSVFLNVFIFRQEKVTLLKVSHCFDTNQYSEGQAIHKTYLNVLFIELQAYKSHTWEVKILLTKL